ncbi:MAG: Methylase involved in ubiquinone/menaquinone biosynthesis [Candidatus Azambacteria bacterium GW2011_GWE2_46_45]|uniref:Methylase involved in ubiquinone/menaquinone biosynthesis n=2 Tax=Candidatus Azamiibacteriota TaxID=1752741 RepID=A0A0G1Q553_9BACT|nr:MAG: Methylase involved in ubiquinone/menaquinone biosynthesis [Candidatus Azambacteria bacterium GW2011_GWA2_45_90]KKU40156.1 MAG: Methylase involved in ubiquinone/menaquinone biosynthesis [Candidatus Azambacteria bacterium GW2011_GWE2_46_45]
MIQTKAKSEGLFNVETIWANLEAKGGSKLPDDSQDLVMIANVLFQSTMKSNILSEAKRILSPAGKLAVIDWRPDAKGVGPEEGYRLSPQECVKIASELGFKLDKEFVAGAYHWGLIFTK